MLGRKLVAAASFVVFVSGAASAQTASSETARTERSHQAGRRAVRGRPRSVARAEHAGRTRRAFGAHDARRRRAPRDRQQPRNGGRAAEPADLRLYARVAARELQPERDVEHRPARQRAPADQPAESRQPERVDDDLQHGHRAEPALGRRQLRADVQQQQSRVADRPAGALRSAVQQLVPLQLHTAAAARIQDRSDAAADADGRHQPRQRRAESEGPHHQHARGGARGLLGLRVFDSGRRRGAPVAARSHPSCSPTTRFASRSARWRRWMSCRPKRKKRPGSRR